MGRGTLEQEAAAADGADKQPRTARGERTRRAILDAAAIEFGGSGFHATSISAITRRAGVALGSFYTWFDSKDAVFRALVSDMSAQVRDTVAPALRSAPDQLTAERDGLAAFIGFVRGHKELYRIIDEAEFVDPESFRRHYASTAERIRERLQQAAGRGEVVADVGEVHAWALMGMNVFVGLRYGVWDDADDPARVAEQVAKMLRDGLAVCGVAAASNPPPPGGGGRRSRTEGAGGEEPG